MVANLWRKEVGLAIGVLAVGIAVSVAGALQLKSAIDARALEDFNRSAARTVDDIVLRFRRTVYGLNGAKGMYAAAQDAISRAQFKAYVDARNLPQEFPGVRGFGLIERVQRQDLDAWLERSRLDGAPNLAIRSLVQSDRDDLFPILFIEPGNRNAGAQGLDIGSEDVRRRGAEQAVISGEPTLSGHIVLVQDNRRSSGALLFVPLYRGGTAPTTAAERDASLLGLLYAPIVMSELLAQMHEIRDGLLELRLFDASNRLEPFFHAVGQTAEDQATATAPERPPRFQFERAQSLLGRNMVLSFNSTPAFEAQIDHYPAWLLLLGGTLVSALLALLVWQQASRRGRAESIARRMTQDLERLAQVVRHTSNAVSIQDRDRRITWINEGFTRITGYTAEEAIGKTPAELLSSESASTGVARALAESMDQGTDYRAEILNRAKDGHEYWIDTEVQPLRDSTGAVTGFMEIGSDVTERRLAQQQLQDVVRDNQALLNTIDMHAIVSVTDRSGTITDVNDAFCRISGYGRDQLLGQNHRIINSGTHPRAFWIDMWRTIASGTPWRGEVCNRARDGSLYWVHTFIAPFRDADGKIEKYISIRIDITASKLAEQDLARERTTLANIIEGTNAGTWEWNVQTGEARVNARWAQMAGYTLDELDCTRIDTWRRLAHPDDLPRSQKLMQQHFRGETPGFECELRIRHRNGHWVWALARGKLLSRDADGAPLWVVGINLDISQRKQAEIALRESENLMRLTTENMGGRLAYFDNERRLQFANQATYDFFGGSAADRIGHRFEEIVGADGWTRQQAAVAGVLSGQAQHYDAESVRGGERSHSAVQLIPDLRNGQVCGFVALAIDVTQSKKAQEELRRADLLLRTAMDAIDAAFVLFGPDDRLVFCNDKYREFYAGIADLIEPGASFEMLIRAAVARGVQAEAIDREEEWVLERLAQHREGNSTLTQRLADGRSIRIVERRMSDGHTVGFRIDITELVQATDAAQAGSRAKSQFLANMSHEIRTPMNAILGLLALLRKTRLDSRQSDYAIKTERAALSLMGLLNDILDISKVESGKLTLDPQEFDTDALMRDLAVILAGSVGDKALDVLFDIDPALPPHLIGDAMRLQQVLVNLGGNAVKFTAEGQVTLSVRVVTMEAGTASVRFEVQDSGIGIAPEHHAHIFSGFSQAEASTTRRFGGTGLGLAISSQLVAMMGGDLRVESQLGQGSRFWFTIALPIPAHAQGARTVPTDPSLALRVLAVGDNAATARLLHQIAAESGWTLAQAVSVAQAGDMLAQASATSTPWQVVLLDRHLCDEEPQAACERLRGRAGSAAPTLVLMLGAHERELLAQATPSAQAWYDGTLIKPFTASLLHDAVHQARHGLARAATTDVTDTSPARRLAGMRLLVAEDNLTNQLVVRELLGSEGAEVRTVANGAAAVAAVVESDAAFDAILMDLQMPVMDGFTATSRIRMDLGRTELPIIAMTANAMASDRAACLAAGMNDHVGKPFDLDHLVRVLQRHTGWLGADRGPRAADDVALEPDEVGSDALAPAVLRAANAAGVDIRSALARLAGRSDVYLRLVRSLASDLGAAVSELQAALARADVAASKALLHSLRGQVATLGATRLAGTLRDCESRLDHGTDRNTIDSAVQPALSALAASQGGIAALLEAMQHALAAPAPDPMAPSDDAALRRDLRVLTDQLKQSDMAATDTIAAMLQHHAGPSSEKLQGLDEAVHALEFDKALRLCQEWLDGA